MANNLDRFKKDLGCLIQLGENLEWAMQYAAYPKEFEAQVIKLLKNDKEKASELIQNLPNFKVEYEAWYSESLVLLKQLLPDRVANFVSFYEKPKGRKDVSYGSYVIQDYLQNLRVTHSWGDVKVDSTAALPQFAQQLSILKAAKSRFESSLFEIRQIVQADLFDSEIDAARELLKGKYYRAAGAIAGVVLEKHLHQVCEDHSVTIVKKYPGISVLNELLKSNSVIDIAQWRHISMLGDIRNLCDHPKTTEPTEEKVTDLIDGVDKILKTVS